jgi:hypothetical protein
MINPIIIKKTLNIQDKFYDISVKNLNKKTNLRRNDMIFIKPNYKYLIPNEKINNNNFDLAFFTDLDKTKKVEKITSKVFVSSGYPYLILVRDRGDDDKIILIIKTPKIKNHQKGGANNAVFLPPPEVGAGYDPKLHTEKGWKIGQYNAPVVNISDLSSEHEDHDQDMYPADPMFGNKEMEGLIEKKKEGFKNYETGFATGFDNGYHKGYYFGYSAAAAYLYRFYKKYYSDYMNKYQDRLKQIANEELNKQKNSMIANLTQNNNENNDIDILGFKIPNFLSGGFLFSDNIYDFEDLDTDNVFEGLPIYMAPENVMTLESLQPPKEGIFWLIDKILNPAPAEQDPDKHCYKPEKIELDDILRKNFHPRFRDAIVGVESNWDEKVFRRSCNRAVLKHMKYCPHENHPGVEYDTKIGKYYKACKLQKDNEKFCTIM